MANMLEDGRNNQQQRSAPKQLRTAVSTLCQEEEITSTNQLFINHYRLLIPFPLFYLSLFALCYLFANYLFDFQSVLSLE